MSADSFTMLGTLIPSRLSFEERFWSKVRKCEGEGCWEWTAMKGSHGYGKFAVSRCNMHLTHRIAWELVHGPIPEGMRVLHRCDNPGCVRPAHLFIGTAKDNTQDMLSKRRHAHGERHGHAKFTAEQVKEIHRLRKETDLSFAKIGAMFGVSPTAIYKIAHGKRWSHVEP